MAYGIYHNQREERKERKKEEKEADYCYQDNICCFICIFYLLSFVL